MTRRPASARAALADLEGAGILAELASLRLARPSAFERALRARRRRPFGADRLLIVAADHLGRGVIGVGRDGMAMADRGRLLSRLRSILSHPRVDGLLATPDVVEDLAVLRALDDKIVFGSMNRGGLAGAVFELDDTYTAYTVRGVVESRLDGGKLMVRVSDQEPSGARALERHAQAIDELAEHRLPTMIEVFATTWDGTRARNSTDARATARAIAVAAALGSTSAFKLLKVPAVAYLEVVASASSLPLLLLGGDPAEDADGTFDALEKAMEIPTVRGLVLGRALLYPPGGDVLSAIDRAARIVGPRTARRAGSRSAGPAAP